eukprot:scaffold57977_cov18-Tisochrysis_lutea.AAC.1
MQGTALAGLAAVGLSQSAMARLGWVEPAGAPPCGAGNAAGTGAGAGADVGAAGDDAPAAAFVDPCKRLDGAGSGGQELVGCAAGGAEGGWRVDQWRCRWTRGGRWLH